MAKSIFKKHLCPSERPQKAGSAWVLISLRGGFLRFLPSVCVLSPCSLNLLWVPPHTPSYPTNSVSSDHFSYFPPSRPIYINTTPSILPLFLPVFLSVLFLFHSPFILSPGFPGCKWLTSRVVKPSKKACCYHLEINLSMCQCLYDNTVGCKMLSSAGGDVG